MFWSLGFWSFEHCLEFGSLGFRICLRFGIWNLGFIVDVILNYEKRLVGDGPPGRPFLPLAPVA